jgi:hypothetical protein
MTDKITETCRKSETFTFSSFLHFDWDIAYVDRETYAAGEKAKEKYNIDAELTRLDAEDLYRIIFCKGDKFVKEIILNWDVKIDVDIIKSDTVFTVNWEHHDYGDRLILSNTPSERDTSNIEYRTDAQPLLDRFPSLPAFQKCYWKADTIGRTDFGPTNYWMEGFIVLDKTSSAQLINGYPWESVDLKFTKGIDPVVTGCKEFNWCYNREFETEVMTMNYVGYFFFDKQNGILYFTFENN